MKLIISLQCMWQTLLYVTVNGNMTASRWTDSPPTSKPGANNTLGWRAGHPGGPAGSRSPDLALAPMKSEITPSHFDDTSLFVCPLLFHKRPWNQRWKRWAAVWEGLCLRGRGCWPERKRSHAPFRIFIRELLTLLIDLRFLWCMQTCALYLKSLYRRNNATLQWK